MSDGTAIRDTHGRGTDAVAHKIVCLRCNDRGWYWMNGNDYRKTCECRCIAARTTGGKGAG